MDKPEELGFECHMSYVIKFDEVFEKRCLELIAFKEDFGHCNIPFLKGIRVIRHWGNGVNTLDKDIQ